jgi:modulator of FtsH protease
MDENSYSMPGAGQYDAAGTTVNYAEVAERAEFIRAVYGLLTLSIFSAIIAAWLSAVTDLKVWVIENWILMLVLYFGSIIGCFIARHKTPINMILMLTFTFVSGLWIGPVAAIFPGPVANAGIATAVIFLSLTTYVHVSKKDFSFIGGFLMIGLISVLVMLLLNIIFFHSEALEFGVSVAGVLLFSGFILFDTSNIMKRYPPNEYIAATLDLYLDILNLFWFLLRIILSFAGDN